MNSSTKQHIAYGIIIVLVVSGLLYYQNHAVTNLEADFNLKLSSLSSQLDKLTTLLSSEVLRLEQKDVELVQNITGLGKSLTEREEEIKSLTGELGQLKVESAQQISELEENIQKLKIENQDFSAIIDDIVKAVVSVKTNVGSGSGFIVDLDGYIVTNYHVVQGATAAIILTNDGGRHSVRSVGYDEAADIAVLKIDASGLSRLKWGDSGKVKIGEKVIAVGSPGGLDFSVTQGIVSAFRTSKGNNYVQIDVPINPGNSGGPLVTIAGEAVGVNSLKISGFEGVGFAIASNQVKDIVDPIIDQDEELLAQIEAQQQG